jgi:hypothetical protein
MFRNLEPKSYFLQCSSRDFSPQANYTDLATAACRRASCQLLRVEGVAWSAPRIPMAIGLDFLDP